MGSSDKLVVGIGWIGRGIKDAPGKPHLGLPGVPAAANLLVIVMTGSSSSNSIDPVCT
jgi:hypothetical protein